MKQIQEWMGHSDFTQLRISMLIWTINPSFLQPNATPVPVLYPATGCITRRGLQGVASSGQGVALTFQ